MKKWKRSTNVKKLDALVREIRMSIDQGVCQKCGRMFGKLDTSHIFPKRTYPHMRFMIDNVKMLCFRCHRLWWHEHPTEATEWVIGFLGKEKYQYLKECSWNTPLVNRSFLEGIEQELNKLKESL